MDVVILNSGLFLIEILKGWVNQDQFYMVLLYLMYLLNVILGGNDLICLVLEIEKNCQFLCNYLMKGMGFCGKIFGQMVYNGIMYDFVNY